MKCTLIVGSNGVSEGPVICLMVCRYIVIECLLCVQVIAHSVRRQHSDIHRFEKISNIVKQFKLSCRCVHCSAILCVIFIPPFPPSLSFPPSLPLLQ